MALTGAAFASTAPQPAETDPPPVPPAPVEAEAAGGGRGSEECLARAVCTLKAKVGARKTWSAGLCRAVAGGVVASAARHDLSPALLLAVMIHESDLDENAARVSHSRGRLAKDSGLMGIRCVLGKRGRCTNSLVRGLPWRQVMDPVTNIELGARYLAHYRDGAVSCRHRDHAYWAHYNHGTRYIGRGQARFYPRNVAALYAALGETLGLDTSELDAVGGGARLAAQRSEKLCAKVRSAAPVCPPAPAVALLSGF